jgi:hypothetical protein
MSQIWRSSSSASVCILRLDMVLCRLVSIGSAAADMRRGSRAVDVESAPADRRRGYTDGAIAFAHCSSARCGLPAAGHNNSSPTRAAL